MARPKVYSDKKFCFCDSLWNTPICGGIFIIERFSFLFGRFVVVDASGLFPTCVDVLLRISAADDVDGHVFEKIEGVEEDGARFLPESERGEHFGTGEQGKHAVAEKQPVHHRKGQDDEHDHRLEPEFAPRQRIIGRDPRSREHRRHRKDEEENEGDDPEEVFPFPRGDGPPLFDLFGDLLFVFLVALGISRQPAHPSVEVVLVMKRLFRIDDGVGIEHRTEPLEQGVELEFIVLGQRAVGPAADAFDDGTADHHALSAHVEGHVLLHAVLVPQIVENGPSEGGTVRKDRPRLFPAEIVFDIFAGEEDVEIVLERVVEFGKIGLVEHGVGIDDDERSIVRDASDRLEIAVERVSLAGLVGDDKDLCTEFFRKRDRGIVGILDDDVDVEKFLRIVLFSDGSKEVADRFALIPRGNDDGNAPHLLGFFIGRLLKRIAELDELGDVQQDRQNGQREIEIECDRDGE